MSHEFTTPATATSHRLDTGTPPQVHRSAASQSLVLPVMPGVTRNGLLLLVDSDVEWTRRPGYERLARVGSHGNVLHHHTDQPLWRAREIRRQKGVLAIAVQPRGRITASDRLALSFADHLRRRPAHLASRGGWTGPVIVSARPDVPGHTEQDVRLFHLVSSRRVIGGVSHAVVWEWTPRAHVEAWFGGRLPDLRPLERHIDTLLEICHAAQHGTLLNTSDTDALTTSLRRHPLSGRFLLRHYNLMCRLLHQRRIAERSGTTVDPPTHDRPASPAPIFPEPPEERNLTDEGSAVRG
ncbi:hypothetical protein LWC34_29455 [Kibdelosporangium philippinense]|uniref:Uncharacterized protein n=1 Tax=Kibdelosporangium philippinense TaxID=211113 RepID=A0ABS8ZHT3_9PSEU|nr:hypothetical protein [Kibdelosporangium philippinense]MCE7006924.1 hypothetical protein [Kibdelosporangium philippinense]